MSARQLIVLVVAAIAAIGALFLIRGMGGRRDHQATENAQPIAGEQVLVAAHDVPQGASLAPGDLAVATFPNGSVAPGFVRLSAQPSAQADFVGAVTRRAFAQGEPISSASVIQPDGHGFMAAQLQSGYRAVAIEISDDTAVGGFIQPNDHVDVIMSRKFNEGSQEQVSSEIVLRDIRVLAIGDHTQTQTSGQAPETIDGTVAVLEMSAEDARILAQADQLGDINLALRGVQAETVGLQTQNSGGVSPSAGAVRIHAYGTVIGGDR